MGKPGQGNPSLTVGAEELPQTELLQPVLIRGRLRPFCSLPVVVGLVVVDRVVDASLVLPDEGKRREMVAVLSVEWRKSLGELCVCRTTSGQVSGGPEWG